jgi:hypothetical protein
MCIGFGCLRVGKAFVTVARPVTALSTSPTKMTPYLFHGPGSRDRSVREASQGFRLLCPPVGDDGLKVDDARLLVELLGTAPVGDRRGSVVLGPLDRATGDAADALLKTLEDYAEGPTQVFAWAWGLSAVLPTIRSRTLPLWCPNGPDPLSGYNKKAQSLVDALNQNRIGGLLEILSAEPDDLAREDLLLASLAPLAKAPKALEIWPRLRKMLTGRGVSKLSAATALLGLAETDSLASRFAGRNP